MSAGNNRDFDVVLMMSTSTILEFPTSDVSRTFALDFVLDRECNSWDEMDILRDNAKPRCINLVLVFKCPNYPTATLDILNQMLSVLVNKFPLH